MSRFLDFIGAEINIGDIVVATESYKSFVAVVVDGSYDMMYNKIELTPASGNKKLFVRENNIFDNIIVVTASYLYNNTATWVHNILNTIDQNAQFRNLSPVDYMDVLLPVLKSLERYMKRDFHKFTSYKYIAGKYSRVTDYTIVNGKKILQIKSGVKISGDKYKLTLCVNAPYQKPSGAEVISWDSGHRQYAAAVLQVGNSSLVLGSNGQIYYTNPIDINGINPLAEPEILNKIQALIDKCIKS